MGKITSTNCGVCWIQDNRETPGTWAHIDGKDVDFYCDPHLRSLNIDVAECETIEAWRRMNGMPIGDASAVQATKAASSRPAAEVKPTREPKYCTECGKRLRWGWPSDKCRSCEGAAGPAKRPYVRRTERAKKETEAPKTPPVKKQSNGNVGAQQVAGLQVTVMPLQEYRERFPMRNSGRELDAIVSFVAGMDRGCVARFETPKGAKVKSFRDRIAKMLARHNMAVTVEQNQLANCVAVIRKEQA